MARTFAENRLATKDSPRFPIFTTWNFAATRFDKFQPTERRNTPDLDAPVPVLPT